MEVVTMIKTLLLIILLTSSFSFASAPTHKPVKLDSTYYDILKIHPQIDPKQAQIISHHITRVATRYGLDKYLLVAIMAQESMFNNSAKNCNIGIDKKGNSRLVCFDFGILEVNFRTAEAHKFSLKRIMSDVGYSIDCGAKVLLGFKKVYEKKEPQNYWTRYNSSSSYWRGHYKTLVCRYYVGDEYCKKTNVQKKYQKTVDKIQEVK